MFIVGQKIKLFFDLHTSHCDVVYFSGDLRDFPGVLAAGSFATVSAISAEAAILDFRYCLEEWKSPVDGSELLTVRVRRSAWCMFVSSLDNQDPIWVTTARKDIGTREGVGAANNPKVVAYFRDAGFAGVTNDEVAWCAAFVGAQLRRSGVLPDNSLRARDYEKWGVRLKRPVFGCVGVRRRHGGGHVGFVVGARSRELALLGGNQDQRVSIEWKDRAHFTDFRWPSYAAVPYGTTLPVQVPGARGSGGSEA